MSAAPRVRHPIFARMYTRLAVVADKKGGAAHRDELLAGAAGRVIEVGAGSGANFAHYPTGVTEVVAVEPETYLRAKAEATAQKVTTNVHVVDGTADHLPVDDASCDIAVASLVLCSVPDQSAALAELRRVIRPGGELRFYEHIRSHNPRLAKLQRRIDLVHPWLGGGCHASRETDRTIEGAGFVVERRRYFTFKPSILELPTSPMVIGLARPA